MMSGAGRSRESAEARVMPLASGRPRSSSTRSTGESPAPASAAIRMPSRAVAATPMSENPSSRAAAGVSGAGLATLAGGLQAHRPELLDGVGLIVGIDRFMSEARAVTNFSGNAVATLLVGSWTKTVDMARVDTVLSGKDPFDELTMLDEHDSATPVSPKEAVPA